MTIKAGYLKRIFGHILTGKAQISLRIRSVLSRTSLPVNRIIEHDYRMYECAVQLQWLEHSWDHVNLF